MPDVTDVTDVTDDAGKDEEREKDDDGREPFIRYLEGLRDNPFRRRSAMPALKLASRRDLQDAPSAWPYVLRWCSRPGQPLLWRDQVYLVVACLFAQHQISWPQATATAYDNMGASLARLRFRSGGDAGFDQKVALLLQCDREGVHHRLHSLIIPLAEWEVPIHWSVLLRDLLAWPGSRGHVALRWARAYHGYGGSEDGVEAVTEEDVVDG